MELIKHGLLVCDNSSTDQIRGTLSVDEQIVPSKCRISNQPEKKNKKRWGFKSFMICSSQSGVNHKIDFYFEKNEATKNGVPADKN